jgi:hypothetical protein
VRIEPTGPVVVDVSAIDLAVLAAIDGCGILVENFVLTVSLEVPLL